MKNSIPTGPSNKPFARKPFLLVLFLAIEIFIVFFFINDYRRYDNLYRQQISQSFDANYRGALASYDQTTKLIFDDVVNVPDVLTLIASALDDKNKRDTYRNELYRLMLPLYEKQKDLGIWQFHFHMKDGTSLLRMHAPGKYGDNLFRRHAVYLVNKEQTPVKGYEVGYFADGYRFMYPLHYRGSHTGSVEFAITSHGIIDYMKRISPGHYYFMIDRTLVDSMAYQDWKKMNFKASELSDRFVIGPKEVEDPVIAGINKKLNKRVNDRLARMQQFVEKETVNGEDHLIVFLPIKDVTGRPAAYFVQYLSDEYSGHHAILAIIYISLFTTLIAGIFYSINLLLSKRKSLEQKNIELENVSNELQQYKLLSRYARDIILFIESDGRIIEANEAAEKAYGYSREDLRFLNIADLRSRDTLHSIEKQMDQSNEMGLLFETRHLRRDSSTFPVEVSSVGVDIGARRVLLSIIRDITVRKKAEEELRIREELLRGAQHLAKIGNWSYEIQNGELWWSAELSRMFSLRTEDGPVTVERFLSRVHPDDRKGLEAQIASGTTYRSDYRIVLPDGQIRYIHEEVEIRYDRSGNKKGFSGTAQDVTERMIAEEKIRNSLKEKETLLREIHHRVKNNMQVITSLLNLQAQKMQDKNLKKPFEESEQRIRAMALVHERLYQKEDLSGINFGIYIHTIIRELKAAYHIDGRNIDTKINVEDIVLEIDSAIPCGLIINELITNCFKYAFPGDRDGEVVVSFTKKDGMFRLIIRDNGVGLPPGFDCKETSTLGMQIVNILAKQLLGSVDIRSDGGTEAVITFSEKKRIGGKKGSSEDGPA